jgi:GNAT superfamily N-acetyltransferase
VPNKHFNIVTFSHNLHAKDCRIFEEVYESELQMEDEDKDFILNEGNLGVWMYVDGYLAGESYGIRVGDIGDLDDPDEPRWTEDVRNRVNDIYCCSTTILPLYQGRGLGGILKSYWLGYARAIWPYEVISGHATTPAMVAINRRFGAKFLSSHENWYGTKREAHFYVIEP